MVSVYVIESADEFCSNFSRLAEDASTRNTENIHVVGMDLEYICKQNNPESFELSHKWIPGEPLSGLVSCVLQISSTNVCFVINLVKMGVFLPKKLTNVITKGSWLKMGVGVEHDLKLLSENYNLGHCCGAIELKSVALVSKINQPNLLSLYSLFVGKPPCVKNTGGVRDWGTGHLTDEDLDYASWDAIMSYRVGMAMLFPHCKKTDVDIPRNSHFVFQELVKHETGIYPKTPNYIGLLQEYAQKLNAKLPVYIDQKVDDLFYTKCIYESHETIGHGTSKKKAKCGAAMEMCHVFKLVF